MSTTPNLELPEMASNILQPSVPFNQAMQRLDIVAMLIAVSNTVTTPPTTVEADEGKCWIVPASGATGAWVGHDNDVALCTAPDLWVFLAPREGWHGKVLSDGEYYVFESGAWIIDTKVKGDTGPAGNSLNRPTGTLVSSSGVATIDLADGIEVYDFPLTENVTSWAVSNLPAVGKVAELRVVVTQNASPKTCVSPASAGHTAGADPWVVSSVAGAIESLGLAIEHDGTITLFASGVYG